MFSGYTTLKLHFYRHHNSIPNVNTIQDVPLTPLKCTLSLCDHQCQGAKLLIAHLKEHITEGCQVSCPVRGCKSGKSSFTSHMSRKHRHWSENVIHDTHNDSPPAIIQEPASVSDTEDSIGDYANFSDLYLRNFCMFYMKLQAQHLLPVYTIQNIVEEIQNIHELGQTYTFNWLNLLLKDMSVSDEDIVKISDAIKQSDLFTACHAGPLRTAYSRSL